MHARQTVLGAAFGAALAAAVALTLGAAAAPAAPAAPPEDHSRDSYELYRQAATLHFQGRYAAAAAAFEDLVGRWGREHGPTSASVARALLSLGWSRQKGSEPAAAEAAFRRALAIEEGRHGPDDGACAEALRALGILYQGLERWEDAATAYDRAVVCLGREALPSLPTLADVLERFALVLRHLPRDSSWFGLARSSRFPTPEALLARAATIRSRLGRRGAAGGN